MATRSWRLLLSLYGAAVHGYLALPPSVRTVADCSSRKALSRLAMERLLGAETLSSSLLTAETIAPILPSSLLAVQTVAPASIEGASLGLAIGGVLGLLGGGGSVLALPAFIYAFGEPTSDAIAESLVVVSIGAGVGLTARGPRGVDFGLALPFAAVAVSASAATAQFAGGVPDSLRLSLFVAFALASSATMWTSAALSSAPAQEIPSGDGGGFTAATGLRAAGVGALTALIGAGGGFVVVPALTLSGVPVESAVSSALLVVALNAAGGFASYAAGGDVVVHWDVVGPVAASVATGAALGARASTLVDPRLTKRLFAALILVLTTGVVANELGVTAPS